MTPTALLILTLAFGSESERADARHGATSAQATLPSAFNKTFVGRLGGKYEVRMHLDRADGDLSGRYSYRHIADSLLGLKGATDTEGNFTLEEFDAGRRTGVFRGRLTRQIVKGVGLLKLSGTWSTVDGRKAISFELVEEHITLDGETVVYSTTAIDDENEKLGYDIDAEYPQFEGVRHGVVQKLNEQIKTIVASQAAEFRKQAEEWASERRTEAKPGDDPPDPSQMTVSYEVLAADHGLVSLRFSTSRHFPGTAHPSHDVAVFNYSLRAARMLELSDLFTSGSPYLKTIATFCIAELDLDDSWPAGAEPKRENYTLWNVTREGLLITFDEYQVAPYAAGIPTVTIPYSELARVLRKAGPLAPFAKR